MFILITHNALLMKKNLPFVLVWSRAALAMLVLCISIPRSSWAPNLIAWSIPLAVISDIFDGILARRWGVSSEKLRRLDSQIDLFYWLSLLVAFMLCVPGANAIFWPWIGIAVLTEITLYLTSFLRFGKEPCTHAYVSKAWCIVLASCLFYSFINENTATMRFALIFGYVAQLDVLLILCVLPSWQKDIPSCYHAWQIRKGRAIRRYPLFNG